MQGNNSSQRNIAELKEDWPRYLRLPLDPELCYVCLIFVWCSTMSGNIMHKVMHEIHVRMQLLGICRCIWECEEFVLFAEASHFSGNVYVSILMMNVFVFNDIPVSVGMLCMHVVHGNSYFWWNFPFQRESHACSLCYAHENTNGWLGMFEINLLFWK